MSRVDQIAALVPLLLTVAISVAPAQEPGDEERAGTIRISEVIPFAERAGGDMGVAASGIKDRIRSECDVGRSLSELTARAAERHGIELESVADIEVAEGRVLMMEIEGAHGGAGGSISGTKSLTVRGELRDGDRVVGSFVARRQHTKIIPAGNCHLFEKLATTVARDIGKWLKSPRMKARLGSA